MEATSLRARERQLTNEINRLTNELRQTLTKLLVLNALAAQRKRILSDG